MGRSMAQTQKRRLWLVALGGILGLALIVSGVMALSLAFLGMGYFPPGDSYIGWDSYHGDYVVGWYHIRLLQLTTVTGLVGGFFVSKALQKRRHPLSGIV